MGIAWVGGDMKQQNTPIILAYAALAAIACGILGYDHYSRLEASVPDLVVPAQVRLHAAATETDAEVEANGAPENSAEAEPNSATARALAAH